MNYNWSGEKIKLMVWTFKWLKNYVLTRIGGSVSVFERLVAINLFRPPQMAVMHQRISSRAVRFNIPERYRCRHRRCVIRPVLNTIKPWITLWRGESEMDFAMMIPLQIVWYQFGTGLETRMILLQTAKWHLVTAIAFEQLEVASKWQYVFTTA